MNSPGRWLAVTVRAVIGSLKAHEATLTLLTGLALSCVPSSSAVVSGADPTPVAPPSAVATAAEAAPVPRGVTDLGTVRAPTRVVCTLEPQAWSGGLALRRGGSPFATVSMIATTISLAADEETRWAVANVDTRAVSLRGLTAGPPLFLKKRTALAGFLLPNASTAFEWEEAVGASNSVTITFDVSASFAVPLMVKEDKSCADLTLTPSDYDPRTLFAAENLSSEGIVGGDVELRLSPGSPPSAKTKPRTNVAVFVLKSGKDFSRVLLDIGNGYAFGWIASHDINRSGRIGGRVGFARVGVAYADKMSNQCGRDLELIGEVDGERATIGSLKAGAAFEPGADDDESKLTQVSPKLQWLQLASGAKLWVRTSELKACSRTPS